jgi:hypothetical protein
VLVRVREARLHAGVVGDRRSGDVDQVDALERALVDDVELADRDLDDLRGHRLAHLVAPDRAAAGGHAAGEHAVGGCRRARGHVDHERVRRLVGDVVVDRVDLVRPVGLAGGHRAVPCREPAEGQDAEREVVEVGRVEVRARRVQDRGAEALVVAQGPARGDHELLAVDREVGRAAVDADAADGLAVEVEVEARQRLGGAGFHGQRADHGLRARGGRIAQGERVVLRVVAAVAERREQAVADAGRARRRPVVVFCGCRAGQQAGR